ncbi:ABC transporter ATP-binding protein [Spiroplasma chinense]|uniref:ABC transporter ATP-binding protein n=1 Tax=Spiroplasma chinense TaxID=216932 RepID=A0A5B9Y488_9MOLU|nr:ABC transporter ATP-binding protein [Spiroplasma chinense]QEH61573.1 ABC transporter ATP-binding protein [Spiroplasma chinense]
MIRVENLTKLFSETNGARDISFELVPGDIVGMVGDNGAGKSTIIKTFFNEYRRNDGKVYYNNEVINKRKYKDFAFFPDQSIYPRNISIERFCIYSGCLSNMSKKESKSTTLKLLRHLELFEHRTKTFKELSAGMQKKALLAITMVSDPEVIILDEPTSNLDVKSRIEFLDILKRLSEKNKIIVITSHIINELQGLVNRVLIIKDSRLVLDKYLENNEKIIDLYQQSASKHFQLDKQGSFEDIFS